MIMDLRPYKINKKKFEDKDDVCQMISYISSILQGSYHNQSMMRFGGINIDYPEDLVSNPNNIANQFLALQSSMGIEEARCKRIYTAIYPMDRDRYKGITMDVVYQWACILSATYSAYQSVFAVCGNRKGFNVYFIWSNFSENGTKMTKCFDPKLLERIVANSS